MSATRYIKIAVYVYVPPTEGDADLLQRFKGFIEVQVKAGPWDSVRDKLKQRMLGNWRLVRIYCRGHVVAPVGYTDARRYNFCFVAEQHYAHFREYELLALGAGLDSMAEVYSAARLELRD
jgi:hypothetical protein